MPKAPSKTVVFLSHAEADKHLAEAFLHPLATALGITEDRIFCSSIEGLGVPKGNNFVTGIRKEIESAKAVVALVTPAYLDSAFCMGELGAAWVLRAHRLPIVVPPNGFEQMVATLLGIAGVRIDSEEALIQGLEDLCKKIGAEVPQATLRSRAVRKFLKEWESLKGKLAGASRIEASVHQSVIQERDAAIESRDAAEAELSKAEKQIAALRKAKNAADVAKIDAAFSDTSNIKIINDAFEKIRELLVELGGSEIARTIILDSLGKFVRPNAQEYREQVHRAIELDVYSEDDYKWNYGHEAVKQLRSLVNTITEAVNETDDADLTANGFRTDPKNIKFWEAHI